MSDNIIPSIETLPIELFYRIFDNLDVETMLFSIRPLCRLFRSAVHNYDRYDLNLKLISKSNFYILCRLINPQHVTSLTLSNDEQTSDQIDLFISLVSLHEFTRLRFLTLLNIDEGQLNFILEKINRNFLNSFIFNIGEYDHSWIETTGNLLSSTITQSTLRKLEFDTYDRMPKILSPMNCTIQYMTINNNINIDDLRIILRCSPHLHTLIMNKIPKAMINDLTSIRFSQVTSLTITDVDESIDDVELFLLLTPSLNHLKLTDEKNMIDGKRWEQFIGINLLQLNKFEFFFNEWKSTEQTPGDLELMIVSFQTPFWVEHKKWFVICESNEEYSRNIYLYSIPLFLSRIIYIPISKEISLSTYPVMMKNDPLIIDNINSLSFNLDKSVADEIEEKKSITNHPLFPKVTDIDLDFSSDRPLFSLQSLSVYIDISRIVRMKISNNGYNENTWIDIGNFFEQAHSLSSLSIHYLSHDHQYSKIIKKIYSILPLHIKHLLISIGDLSQLKMIFERCKKLSTIQLELTYVDLVRKVIKWFTDNTINTTCREGYRSVHVWLGKEKNSIRSNTVVQTNEINQQ